MDWYDSSSYRKKPGRQWRKCEEVVERRRSPVVVVVAVVVLENGNDPSFWSSTSGDTF